MLLTRLCLIPFFLKQVLQLAIVRQLQLEAGFLRWDLRISVGVVHPRGDLTHLSCI